MNENTTNTLNKNNFITSVLISMRYTNPLYQNRDCLQLKLEAIIATNTMAQENDTQFVAHCQVNGVLVTKVYVQL